MAQNCRKPASTILSCGLGDLFNAEVYNEIVNPQTKKQEVLAFISFGIKLITSKAYSKTT